MISRFAKSLFIIIFVISMLAMLAMFHPPSRAYIDPWSGQFLGEGGVALPPKKTHDNDKDSSPVAGVEGGVIMPKLGNETAKAALGRATWKLLHTVTLRFPERPTDDERDALDSYFHLTSRLYPCGECASEFQELLKKYPPQTSSRGAAALWLCMLHNEVNKRLEKPEFDCSTLSSEYDCGCGDDPLGEASKKGLPQPLDDLEPNASKDEITGAELIMGGR